MDDFCIEPIQIKSILLKVVTIHVRTLNGAEFKDSNFVLNPWRKRASHHFNNLSIMTSAPPAEGGWRVVLSGDYITTTRTPAVRRLSNHSTITSEIRYKRPFNSHLSGRNACRCVQQQQQQRVSILDMDTRVPAVRSSSSSSKWYFTSVLLHPFQNQFSPKTFVR